jgi:glycosyltransferase involved in cell wall biosynthesis
MSYILITPAKNEEEFLPIVAESVIHQTKLPILWLIVDDGSTDGTPNIIDKLTSSHPWIISIQLPPHPRDLFYHYSFVCKEGFDYLIDYSSKNAIKYEYIGLLDADTKLDPSYFEKLIAEFRIDTSLGIASGTIYDKVNGNIIKKTEGYLPRGTGRLWTKKCFEVSEGYKVEAAAHSISNVKAILRGYTIKKFDTIIAIQLRGTRSAEGLWKTYQKDGWLAYYLNKHPLLVFLNCIYHTFTRPYYTGIPYLFGYLSAVIKRGEKISDIEIRNYYWNIRLYDYLPQIKFLSKSR